MDIERILQQLSNQGLVRLNKPLGRYYSIYCPFHNDGNERKPSCGVLIHSEVRNGTVYPEGFVHCFTCGYSKSLLTMISDVLKLRGSNLSGQAWLTKYFPEFVSDPSKIELLLPASLMDQLNNQYAIQQIKHLQHKTAPAYVSDAELSQYRFYVDYMFKRGLTEEIIQKYDIGVDLNFVPKGRKHKVPCITFPVRDHVGNTLFISRRSIEGKSFYLPEDIEKPLYGVYELPKHCKQVLLTESCFNTLTSVKYGIPSLAMFGTGTPHQINLIRQLGIPEIILGLDPDEAGIRGTRRLKNGLKDVAIVRTLQDIPEGKDINDLDYNQFMYAIKNRI